jgi:hypothetical protein
MNQRQQPATTMTHQPGSSQPTTTAPTVVADLIRRNRDLEIPSPGLWRMAPGSYVAIAPSRREPLVARRVLEGAIDIDETPDQSSMRFTVAGPDEMTFQGRPTRVVANHHGMSEWAIEGALTHNEQSSPMTLVVSYHGVYRSSGRVWAWFSGRGAVVVPSQPRRWRSSRRNERATVALDLILDPPQSARSPSTVSRAA